MILQTGRDLSLVLDLMEDHLTEQIHRMALALGMVPMEDPWEEQALEDRWAVILQTGKGLSLVWDLMEDHFTDRVEMTQILQAMVKSLTQMEIHWEGPPQRIPWVMGLDLMVDQCQVMVQMENPWEDQGLEDRLAVILQTGRGLILVLDLMEDHLTEQIHRMALALGSVLMEDPWEEQALEDR